MSGSTPRSGISFSLKGSHQPRHGTKNRAIFDDDEDTHDGGSQPRDIPLGVKRKREAPVNIGPKVIPLTPTSDWREDRKRRLGLLDKHATSLGSLASMRPHGTAGSTPTDAAPEKAFTEAQKQGLIVRTREKEAEPDRASTPPTTSIEADDVTPPASPRSEPTGEPTDEEALRALLSEKSSTQPSAFSRLIIQQPSEEDMFRHDVDTRPDEPSLTDYATMPVQEFGAAMLRGMGWKDGMGVGRKRNGPTSAPSIQRRAALLGLGAKERAIPSQKRDADRRYTPVLRRDDTPSSRSSRDSERDHDSRREYRDRSSSSRDRDRYHDRERSRYSDRDRDRPSFRSHDRDRGYDRRHSHGRSKK